MDDITSRSRVGRIAGLLAAFAVVATACGGSTVGVEYKDPQDRALFVLPDGWNLYDADELVQVQSVPFGLPFSGVTTIQQVAFDGAPGHDPGNLVVSAAASEYPIGVYTVRTVGSAERDTVSRSFLEETVVSSQFYDIGNEILAEDIDFGRDYEGIRRFLPFQDTTTQDLGVVYFVTITNPDDSTIFTIAAGCSAACWETFQDDIQGVVDSWIVNTRQ